MKNDRANTLELLDDDKSVNSVAEEPLEELSGAQHARFRARFRELANAMSQHPLADQLADSIDTLRRIADGETKNH